MLDAIYVSVSRVKVYGKNYGFSVRIPITIDRTGILSRELPTDVSSIQFFGYTDTHFFLTILPRSSAPWTIQRLMSLVSSSRHIVRVKCRCVNANISKPWKGLSTYISRNDGAGLRLGRHTAFVKWCGTGYNIDQPVAIVFWDKVE